LESSCREKLSGVYPPNMTCFENEQVAYGRIRENIERYNATAVKGFFPLGSNGEFRSLTDTESLKIVDVYRRHRGKGKVLMVGAARESLKATVEFVKKVADKGADFATILPPHYFVSFMTEDALIRYFTMVADASPIPVMVYNAPKFAAGLVLSPRLITAVSAHPRIAGLKDTSKEDIAQYVNAVAPGADFSVMAGTIEKFYKGLLVGAVGGVLSIANYLPEMCCDLHALHLAGKREEAEALDARARALSGNAAGKAGVAGVKAAMDVRGYFGGDPRLPLLPLGEKEKADLRAALALEGLA
jgi:4-hydroxy-2-oxoglutarate aldolase